ncbi:MAG: hypothetical protein LBU18_05695 [Treponema sp.]|jgi:hypothetical protein|nr:hypothetical protein [Treponema sp.]
MQKESAPPSSIAAKESPAYTVFRVLCRPRLRKAALRAAKSMVYNFFFLQYKAALLPGRIPVSSVDHPLDAEIPFSPKYVAVYLDFVAFWIRAAGFLLSQYGRRAEAPVMDFIDTLGQLYAFAAEIYTENLSTTRRPRYYGSFRFVLIHAADPHLMCIPSLHVMVVIRTYTKFRAVIRSMGDEERFAAQLEELRQGALDITEAVLYVKQHSVNCVSASLYAMSRFDPALFPGEEAAGFVSALFTRPGSPGKSESLRAYIFEKYRQFLDEGKLGNWKAPLLDFLASRGSSASTACLGVWEPCNQAKPDC